MSLITVREAARRLSVKPDQVRTLLQEGDLVGERRRGRQYVVWDQPALAERSAKLLPGPRYGASVAQKARVEARRAHVAVLYRQGKTAREIATLLGVTYLVALRDIHALTRPDLTFKRRKS